MPHVRGIGKYPEHLFAALCSLLMPLTAIAGEGGEDFLNVKSWHGEIQLTISESLSSSRTWEAGNESRNLSSTSTYRFRVQTQDGMSTPVDPFVGKEEPKGNASREKGDLMHGRDMGEMQKSMQRSGIDPAMMGMIMGEMNKMKGLHISGNKYKSWSVTSTEAKTTTGSYQSSDVTKGSGIDASGQRCSYRRALETEGRFKSAAGLTLVVNLQKHAYSFKWGVVAGPDKTAKQRYSSVDSCDGNEAREHDIAFPFMSEKEFLPVEFEPLPSGLSLTGSKKIRNELKDGKTQDISLSWVLTPSGTEVPSAEVSFDTKGDEWIPEEDNLVGASVAWGEKTIPSQIRFTLYDISEEPGISLNSKDKNVDPDLEFSEGNEANGYKITQSGKTYAAVKEDISGKSEHIVLHARDFGAYGKLKAEIEVGGTWLTATAKPFDLQYLPVPFDENQNKIADKWEKDVGVYARNLGPEWDEDPYPQGQKSDGDGFTLYEEYRGFQETGHVFKDGKNEQVKDGHVRMDPMYKDVFIHDVDGLFIKYYKPYNSANLNWHLISQSMMKGTGSVTSQPDYRWVNFNTSKKYFSRNQFAVYIENGHASPDPKNPNDQGHTQEIELYEVMDCAVADGNFKFPLKCWAKVSIYPDGISSFIARNYKDLGLEEHTDRVVGEMLGNAVIHEIGHSLGITHHRSPGVSAFTDEGRTVGVSTCAMRYDAGKEMKRPDIHNYYRTTYCKAGDTYSLGEIDESGSYKLYQGHNCYGQINIKGD